jgi:hypothetical protein
LGYQSGIAEELSSCKAQNIHGRVDGDVNRKRLGRGEKYRLGGVVEGRDEEEKTGNKEMQ